MQKQPVPADLSAYPLLLKMDEVAEILRVDRKYAYEMARRAGFPVMNIGTDQRAMLRVPKHELLNWMEREYGVKVTA
ncbi:helix-turn-helix domain-containing protein [Brevibacillus fluminis]|uniref:helix-turn-helix domain-containing protein n=1 Tax=Brevibacillus fluminis TaxID=511487 RepID=UPI003F8BC10A